MNQFPLLASPISLGPVELRNRVVMLPHATHYSELHRTTPRLLFYYRERALGGVGLVVTESMAVHLRGTHGETIDASDAVGMERWAATVKSVNDAGAKLFAQLTHFGAEATSTNSNLPLMGASTIPSPVLGENVVAMDAEDIAELVTQFGVAAQRVREAGFNGVELKVAHDGIMRQFLSPLFNNRTDGYGGSVTNRLRIVLETLTAIRAAVGPDLAVGVRFCMTENLPGGYGLPEALEFARVMADSGLLDYFSSDAGTWASFSSQSPTMDTPEGVYADAIAQLKRVVGEIPVIAFGGLRTPAYAEQLLGNGTADLIGLARQLITDPEWANKAFEGRLDQIRPCVGCNQQCIGNVAEGLPVSCVHNPAAGREERLGRSTLTQAAKPRAVAVVGGGPAGLKAAEVARRRGHNVTLFEASSALGGQVAVAARAPGHARWGNIVTHLASEVQRLGVDIRLDSPATAEGLRSFSPDDVIWAIGARPGPWPFPVAHDASIHDEFAVILDGAVSSGHAIVADYGVRFEAAAVVETLHQRGCAITWISAGPTVPGQLDPATLPDLLARIPDVRRMPETAIVEVSYGQVRLANLFTGVQEVIQDIAAVVVVGNKVSASASASPGDLDLSVRHRRIGDCLAPRHTAIAIFEGEMAGRAV